MTHEPADRLHCLSDDHWARIESCFPRPDGRKGFPQEIASRDVLEAVLYRTRVGCPWRDLPKEYGYWHTIYTRWNRWVEGGVMQRAMVQLHTAQLATQEIDPVLAMIDSTVVRAHQHAAGAQKKRGRKP